jgi:transcriptional regulator with XRE-family HTH domain
LIKQTKNLYLYFKTDKMKKPVLLFPATTRKLQEIGRNLRLARLRRRLSAEQLAMRAGISRSTLWMIEKGSPVVAFGAYAQVLFVLGLDNDILALGADDELGRKLQDAELQVMKRAPKKKAP